MRPATSISGVADNQVYLTFVTSLDKTSDTSDQEELEPLFSG